MAAAKKAVTKPAVKAAAEKEVKAVAPEAEVKKAAEEAVEKKTVEKAQKKTAEKKPADKTAAKKTQTKKAELKTAMHVQFSGKSYADEDLVKMAKDIWKYDLKQKTGDLESVELYVKPEENIVYYVMNKEFTGSFYI
ncbi:MAG: DUF6465 family protein [bacterium]|nr:DUF6465 family protein [bacterium]